MEKWLPGAEEVGGNKKSLVKGHKCSLIKGIRSENLMYNTVRIFDIIKLTTSPMPRNLKEM